MKDFYVKKDCKYNTFGGCVYPSDFDRHTLISEIADRIVTDWKFDNECRKNIISRDRNK